MTPVAFDTVGAAAYVGLSPATLETKRSRGNGPRFVRLGSRVLYRRADLEEWIASLPAYESTSQYDDHA